MFYALWTRRRHGTWRRTWRNEGEAGLTFNVARWSPLIAAIAGRVGDRAGRFGGGVEDWILWISNTIQSYNHTLVHTYTSTRPPPLPRRPLSTTPTQPQRNSTSNSSNYTSIMVALYRDAPHRDTPSSLSDCCAKTLIQHLAFDPELQDRVWSSTRVGRRNPPLRCSGYPRTGACNLPKLLDSIGFDPVAQTVSWQRSRESPGRDLQLGALVTNSSHPTSRMLKIPTLAPAAVAVRL